MTWIYILFERSWNVDSMSDITCQVL
jgi:hypothetical protein